MSTFYFFKTSLDYEYFGRYWTRRHRQMTRAYVINFPTAAAPAGTGTATAPILPNS